MSQRSIVAGVGAVVALLACGNVPERRGADAASFVDDYCATTAPCCPIVMTAADGVACHKAFGFAASVPYDAVVGGACLDQLHDAQDKNPDYCRNLPTCKAAFHGSTAPGSPCRVDSECLASPDGDGMCVETANQGMVDRTCLLERRGKENDQPCNATRNGPPTVVNGVTYWSGTPASPPLQAFYCDAADGLYCSLGVTSPACVKIKGVGGACNSGFEGGCTADAYCTHRDTCAARLPVGADCTNEFTASGDGCVPAAYCPVDVAGAKCTPAIADGASCTIGGGLNTICISHRCEKGVCVAGVVEDLAPLRFACAGVQP